ncbi:MULTISPECIES: LysR substrate-binding domain-containing protein [unclassified Pseudomonas]|uniref:LysR substrate-binding domain-containing protein n=1 Tax=unclassified Pseudomonas TaxID=196821 RepID=UPI00244C6A83|nr:MULTISPECIES: LysR substrate-binding domain-containing protein [unclassified Pseudomonas]MDH0303661.1 LysR substrate-binding domain-containing protein [Pseudomonas sp. GD04091]MDH1986721.1 LysR substrate-binding domain-containing protein [Pseudomonas sp. GD03689]
MSAPKRRNAPAIINHLTAFEAAARLGSFRAAADELHVTPGAVAQQVRTLEAKLERPLFERLPRGLRTNRDGADYLARVRLALDIIEDATGELLERDRQHDPRQILLSTTPAFASRWLIPRLGQLAQAHPEVAVMIDASDSTRPLSGKGAVDLAVRWGAPPFAESYALPLLPGVAVPVCAPALRGEHQWQRAIDLVRQPLISDSHNNWKRWFDHHALPGTRFNGPVFSQTILAIEAAEQGMGIALVPRLLVENALKAGTLVLALEEHELHSSAGFHLLADHTPEPGSAAEQVARWLESEAKAQA